MTNNKRKKPIIIGSIGRDLNKAEKKAAGPGERNPAAKASCEAPSTNINPKVRRQHAANEPLFSRSTATEAQLAKLIALLRVRPHHTHELRALGVSHPAGRVQDLAKRGFTIESRRIVTVDSDGFFHRGVALYSLIGEPCVANAALRNRGGAS